MKIALKYVLVAAALVICCISAKKDMLQSQVVSSSLKSEKVSTASQVEKKVNQKPKYPEFHTDVDASNALGYVGSSKNFTISAAPYLVTRCDQVLHIQVDRIKNMRNYCEKEPALFTMSIYVLNIFKTSNADSLISSVYLKRMRNEPRVLPGASLCIQISEESSSFAFCLKTEKDVEDVLATYAKFRNCQFTREVNTIINNQTLCANATKIDSTGINPFYAEFRVPGTHE